MRTTLNIEEEALSVIKKYAGERNVSLGQATSDLVFRGASGLPAFKMKKRWALLERDPSLPPLTNEMLDAAEQEDYEEEYRHAIAPRR